MLNKPVSEIDWFGGKAPWAALNPRTPESDARALLSSLKTATGLEPKIAGHIFLATSGTTSAPKWVALSRQALLSSARAVVSRLKITGQDRWLQSLPSFHVGGLAVHARAAIAGFEIVDGASDFGLVRWDPIAFRHVLSDSGATLTSFVPTQIFDLVRAELRAPDTLRAVIVGGGALSLELAARARALGWRVLASYGMTETASMIALSREGSDDLEVLDHVEVGADSDGVLKIRGASLLTAYVFADASGAGRVEFPISDGWFQTEDRVELDAQLIRPLGRKTDFVKIGGESVHLARLEQIFSELLFAHAEIPAQAVALFSAPDDRLGSCIELMVEDSVSDPAAIQLLISKFNSAVLPFERIRATRIVTAISRTELGKLKRV